MDLFKNNSIILNKNLPDLFHLVNGLDYKFLKRNFCIEKGKLGHVYIKGIESSYDPIRHYKSILKKYDTPGIYNVPSVIGFLSGNHIRAVLNIFPVIDVVIFDTGLFYELMINADISDIIPKIRQITIFDIHNSIYGIFSREEKEYCNHQFIVLNEKYRNFYTKNFVGLRGYYFKHFENYPSVTVVSPIYGGSYDISRYLFNSFVDLGYSASFIDFARFYPELCSIRRTNDAALYSGMMQRIDKIIYDALDLNGTDLIIALSQAPVRDKVLQHARGKGILSIFWFIENYRIFDYYKDIVNNYDIFLVFQKGKFLDSLRKSSFSLVEYLPLCAYPATHRKLHRDSIEKYYFSNVSFMGAAYSNRQVFFEKLLRGLDQTFSLWGIGWEKNKNLSPFFRQKEHYYLKNEEIVKIYNASDINLNLHSDDANDRENDFINPRTFEVAACNAFQLTDYRKDIYDFFDDNEITVFRSVADCIEKIGYFMRNEAERRKIARAAYEKVLKRHTYYARIDDIMRILG